MLTLMVGLLSHVVGQNRRGGKIPKKFEKLGLKNFARVANTRHIMMQKIEGAKMTGGEEQHKRGPRTGGGVPRDQIETDRPQRV